MEKSENMIKQADTSKYNLRCNRNLSEKMTKKDFIYDIPTPFQAMRKEKSLLAHPSKKSRNEFDGLTRSSSAEKNCNSSSGSAMSRFQKSSGVGKIVNGSKLMKNSVGLLRLINGQNLLPEIIATSGSAKQVATKSLQLGNERIVKEAEREENDKEIRRQIVLPIQIRRKIGSDSKPTRYSVIPTSETHELNNSSSLIQIPDRKILRYQCNYCEERLATFLSLSTHVKYHRDRIHCKECLWILESEETMTQHAKKAHSVNFSPTTSVDHIHLQDCTRV